MYAYIYIYINVYIYIYIYATTVIFCTHKHAADSSYTTRVQTLSGLCSEAHVRTHMNNITLLGSCSEAHMHTQVPLAACS